MQAREDTRVSLTSNLKFKFAFNFREKQKKKKIARKSAPYKFYLPNHITDDYSLVFACRLIV